MTSIEQNQEQLIQEFSKFSDWEERYKHIIHIGKNLNPLDDKYKTEQNRVKGCQSQTWLHASLSDDKIIYQADSDAMIVRGLIQLMLNVFSGYSPQEIMDAGVDFLTKIGLTTHLSQSRANGLASLVKQFKNYAIAFHVLSQSKKSG